MNLRLFAEISFTVSLYHARGILSIGFSGFLSEAGTINAAAPYEIPFFYKKALDKLAKACYNEILLKREGENWL